MDNLTGLVSENSNSSVWQDALICSPLFYY